MFTAFGSFNPAWKLLSPQREHEVGDVDVFERDSTLHVVVDAPGVAQEDMSVQAEHGLLTISLDRRITPDPSDRILVQQRPFGQRTLRLAVGDRYQLDAATATLDGGVLTVTLPAKAEAKPNVIPVRTARGALTSS